MGGLRRGLGMVDQIFEALLKRESVVECWERSKEFAPGGPTMVHLLCISVNLQ